MCFAGAGNLHILVLKGNKINSLLWDCGHYRLQSFDVSFNDISYIDTSFLNSVRQMKVINIEGNNKLFQFLWL